MAEQQPVASNMSDEEIYRMHQKNELLRSELQQLRKEHDELSAASMRSQEIENLMKSKEKEKKQLTKTLRDLEKEIETVKADIESRSGADSATLQLKKDIDELKEEIKDREDEIGALTKNMKACDAKNARTMEQIKTKQNQIAELCRRLQALQPDKWREIVNSIFGPDYIVPAVYRAPGGPIQPTPQFRGKTSKTQKDIAELERKLKEVSENKDKTIGALQQKVAKTQKQIEKLKQEVGEREKKLDEQDKIIKLLFLQITGLTNSSSMNTRGLAPV
ncbi:hypothetical protein BLNAU_24806 [Blattamonas nauphoetae]|uniref:Uncharacterized protein n=1 Tax=Blattamonas nauphoetae TaxID=2049346 RepID=A0ABQ9WLF0_9EUKA|nr:hypothetical protein BLNAU_24806 [Blattamonas nauphoetae]